MGHPVILKTHLKEYFLSWYEYKMHKKEFLKFWGVKIEKREFRPSKRAIHVGDVHIVT